MATPHKWADVIHAIADGKEVQWKTSSGTWQDAEFEPYTPITEPDLEWRIKPEPKPDVVRYYVAGRFSGYGYHHPDANLTLTFDAETGALKSAEVIHGKD